MSLPSLRRQIDALDAHILTLLQKRMDLARQTKAFKPSVADLSREQEVRAAWKKRSEDVGLSPDFTDHLLTLLFTEAKRLQS